MPCPTLPPCVLSVAVLLEDIDSIPNYTNLLPSAAVEDPLAQLCDWDDAQLDQFFVGVPLNYQAILIHKDALEFDIWRCQCDMYLLRRCA